MAEKRLVIVVDGTAAMGPYWHTILSDYLEKIIRHFCGQSIGQEPSGQIVELGMVMYKDRGPHGCMVQCSNWTRDMETFLEWLIAFSFDGGGFDDAAIAEGLADALAMFPKPPNGSQTQEYFLEERHCILVAASNPFPLPMPLYLPKVNKGFSGIQMESCMADAKAVAGLFPQCFVTLSVISPKQFPKLRELYNEGNDNHSGTDPSLYNAKNPQFLVLLSEKFLEARAALDQLETMSTLSINNAVSVGTNSFPSDSDFRLDLSEEDITFLQNIFGEPSLDQTNSHAGNIPTEASNMESLGLQPAVPEYWCVPPHGFSTSIPIEDEMMVELNPRQVTLSQNTSLANPTAVNGSTKGKVAQQHQIMTSAAEAEENFGGHSTMSIVKESPHEETPIFDWKAFLMDPESAPNTSTHLCTISSASGNLDNSKPAGLGTMSTEPQGVTYAGIHSPHLSMLSPIAKSEPFTSFQRTIGNENLRSRLSQGGQSSVSSSAGPSVSAVGGTENNNATDLDYKHDRYVTAWEGDMSAKYQGIFVVISRIRAYKKITAAETLTADWPKTLQMVRVMPQYFFRDMSYDGPVDYMIFQSLTNHRAYEQLKEKDLCVRIDLPSQTLIFTPTDKKGRFIGTLFPGYFPPLKPPELQRDDEDIADEVEGNLMDEL